MTESSVFMQPHRHGAKSLASVGYFVLLFLGDVCKSLARILVSDEDRVISESSVTRLFPCYGAFESPLKEMLLTIEYQGYYAFESCPSRERLHPKAQAGSHM